MRKPEIGLSMLYCLSEPFPSMMKRLSKLDVKYIELTDDGLHTLNRSRVKALRRVAEAYDIKFVIHAPWFGINIATPTSSLRRATLRRLENSMSCARELECRLWLFHPGSGTGFGHFYPGKDWQLNLESVRSLLDAADRIGVEIAVENTPEPYPSLLKSVDDFRKFYDELGEDIGLVLDVAHAHINNQIHSFVEQFSDKIVHMHASDNYGSEDQHLGIGRGNIDWTEFAQVVKDANYGNLIVVESRDNVEESVQFLRKLFA